jgi:hypothetical protein
VVCSTDRISLSREDGGFFHCTLSTAVIEDEVTFKLSLYTTEIYRCLF